MVDVRCAALRARFVALVFGWGTVGLCYWSGQLAPGTAHVLSESALDRLLPFEVSAIWPYLSFFALIPVAYFCTSLQRLPLLRRAMQLSAVVSVLVFVSWPTTLVYPAVSAATASGTTLSLLAAFDSPQNCLPSLHGALTLLCVVALWQRRQPWRSAFVLLWGVAIMTSAIMTRRHLAGDLGAGIALGAMCWWLVVRLARSAGRARDACFIPTSKFAPLTDTGESHS
jgi:hypothetical protein